MPQWTGKRGLERRNGPTPVTKPAQKSSADPKQRRDRQPYATETEDYDGASTGPSQFRGAARDEK